MPKYSETHHLNIDDAGLASVHVAVHLQDADPRIARLLVLRVLDTASTIAYLDPLILSQTSGPCVHYDERSEHAADTDPCTYPYSDEHSDGVCPHLDNPDIICPVKDACYAMREIAHLREACEAEQEEQDADMAAQDAVYETETPEFVEPTPEEEPDYEASPLVGEMRLDARGWTPEEERAMCGATTPAEAVALYRAAYPGSVRTDAAIKTRYHLKIRPQRGATPAPDFVGDTAPVTQCDEEPDFTVPHPTYRPGDRVRITHALHRGQTGKIERYFPATENYLVAIDGMPDMIILQDSDLEAV